MGVQRRQNIHLPGRGWEQEQLHPVEDRAWDGSWPTARLQRGHADRTTEPEMGPDQRPGCSVGTKTGGQSLRWVLTDGQAAARARRLEDRAWDGSWRRPGCSAGTQTGGQSLRWVLTDGQAAARACRPEEGGRRRGRAWQVRGPMLESFAFEASLHKMLENRQVWLGLGVNGRLVLPKKKRKKADSGCFVEGFECQGTDLYTSSVFLIQ